MSIQETISNKRGRASFSLRLRNRLNLEWQKVSRFVISANPKVYYPYCDLLHTHPSFFRYYERPPLPYSNLFNAELCHWISYIKEKGRGIPYVIEPQDHPLSPAEKSEPGEVLAGIQRVLDTYMDTKCRKILIESEGQRNLFNRYLPDQVLEKTEIIRAGAIVQPVDLGKKFSGVETPVFVCFASDYKKKAVDILIKAWLGFDSKTKCRLILACPNVPSEISDSLAKENIHIISKAPLSSSDKRKLLNSAHVMLAPLHVDGGANVIEAFEYGLPVITMRSQRSFIRDGNGWEVDVPFYFYDEGYGKEWPTWERFWQLLDDAKKKNDFDITVQGFVNIFEEIANSPEKLLDKGKAAYNVASGEFSLETRNATLRRIYSESIRDR